MSKLRFVLMSIEVPDDEDPNETVKPLRDLYNVDMSYDYTKPENADLFRVPPEWVHKLRTDVFVGEVDILGEIDEADVLSIGIDVGQTLATVMPTIVAESAKHTTNKHVLAKNLRFRAFKYVMDEEGTEWAGGE